MRVVVAQSCPSLCDRVDSSPQAALSMAFSRQEYWSGLPFSSSGDLPNPGIKLGSPRLQEDSEPPGKPFFGRGAEGVWEGCGGDVNNRMGFPGGASDKESACQCRRHKRHRFGPWVGKIPWRRKRQPTPVFLPGEHHGQRRLVGYSPWGCKELDMTERARTHTHTNNIYFLKVLGARSSRSRCQQD